LIGEADELVIRGDHARVEGWKTGETASVIMELRRFMTPEEISPADAIIPHARTRCSGTGTPLSIRSGHR
jgi:hypothetical protein